MWSAFAADLEPGSSALALVFEHTWIKPVRDAVAASGGMLLADIHVPAEVVDEVLASVAWPDTNNRRRSNMPRRGRPGLVGTMARTAVIAGTATAVVGATSGSKQAKAQASANQQAAQAQTQAQMAEMQTQLDQLNAEKAASDQQAAVDKAVADALEKQAAGVAAAAPAAASARQRHDGSAPELCRHEGPGPAVG